MDQIVGKRRTEPDDLDPQYRWDRHLPAWGTMAVDFEDRVDMARLRCHRLARACQAALRRSDLRRSAPVRPEPGTSGMSRARTLSGSGRGTRWRATSSCLVRVFDPGPVGLRLGGIQPSVVPRIVAADNELARPGVAAMRGAMPEAGLT